MDKVTEIYSKNVEALEQNGYKTLVEILNGISDEGMIKVRNSKSGAKTFYFGDHLVHSSYDPVKEAKGQVKNLLKDIDPGTDILLQGLGYGYLAEELLKVNSSISITIIEPSLEVFKSCCEERDISLIVKNTTLIVGSVDQIDNRVRFENVLNSSSPSVVSLPTIGQYASHSFDEYSRLIRQSQTSKKKGYRVLVVSPLYGGSYPITNYVTDALKELGHRPTKLDNKVFYEAKQHLESLTSSKTETNKLLSSLMNLMSKSVVSKALEIKAQIVIFMAQSPGTPEILEELRSYGIPTAMWFVEDGELFEYGLKMAPFYDYFFHIQKGDYEEKLKKGGARYPYYLPMAADPSIHSKIELSEDDKKRYGSDLSHVGAGYYNRRNFFLGLLDYEFKLWGNEWDSAGALATILQDEGRRVTTDETVKIFNSTKINLNLHSSTYTKGVNPHGDFVNPRTFELAACSAFQIVDERSLLADMFEPGKEVITFTDLQSCRNAIDYFLNHPDEARKIAEASRKRVLENHTYRHRVEEMMSVILANHEIPFEDYKENTVSALREEAKEDQELTNILANFDNPDEELTLKRIAEVIKSEDGEMNETQALFLLMNEFNEFAKEKGLV